GGIKKWRDEYSEHLRGADVVVLPDNHAEGREHGEQVAASLRGIARRVRMLDIGKHWTDCPDKGDISDWIAAGGTGEKLKEMAAALPEVATSAHNSHSAAGQGPAEPRSDASEWPTMHEAAYYGLAGEVVEAIKPHSEADPVAILIQFLVLA